jgi:hypothetical protein
VIYLKINKKLIPVLAIVAVLGLGVVGCRESNRVSHNISKEADNFNVTRRLVVINARTDKPLFELVGNFALSNNDENELEVVCQTGKNEFKKHYIYLNEYTIYTVEDISGANVSEYKYEVNFLPETIQPITITTKD